MPTSSTRTLSIWAFLAATLALFFALTWQLGVFGGQRNANYTVRLTDASGLVADNAVKIAGVNVGKIATIRVEHRQAVLQLQIAGDVELHEGARALVRAKSLLGEKYLELDPGEREAPLLAPGSEVAWSKDSFDVDELLNAIEPFFGTTSAGQPGRQGADKGSESGLGPLLALVRQWAIAMQLPENQARLSADILAVEAMLRDGAATTATLRQLVDKQAPEIERSAQALHHMAQDQRYAVILGRLDRLTLALERELPAILTNFQATAKQSQDMVAALHQSLPATRLERWAAGGDAMAAAAQEAQLLATSARELVGEVHQLRASAAGDAKPWTTLSRDVANAFAKLNLLLTRLATVDELAIRRFIQEEGLKVNLGEPRRVRQRIDALKEQKH